MKNKELLNLYRTFIIMEHGEEFLKELELKYLVEKTNKMLEIKDSKTFEEERKKYIYN